MMLMKFVFIKYNKFNDISAADTTNKCHGQGKDKQKYRILSISLFELQIHLNSKNEAISEVEKVISNSWDRKWNSNQSNGKYS